MIDNYHLLQSARADLNRAVWAGNFSTLELLHDSHLVCFKNPEDRKKFIRIRLIEVLKTIKAYIDQDDTGNAFSDNDTWFIANLEALIDSEARLVRRGYKPRIDRQMIKEWIEKHL